MGSCAPHDTDYHQAMLKDDVFAGGRPMAIDGIHVGPFAAGQIAGQPGVMMLPNDATSTIRHSALLERLGAGKK